MANTVEIERAVNDRLGVTLPELPLFRSEAEWAELIGIPHKTLATERREKKLAAARARNSATAPVLISRGEILRWLLAAAERAVMPSVVQVAAAKRIQLTAPTAVGGAA